MKVLIVGGGGREHALAWGIHQSSLHPTIVCIPGNAGTAKLGKNVFIPLTQINEIVDYVSYQKFDLIVIGPEEPISQGLGDRLIEKGYRVFAPSSRAARLESSKASAKKLMTDEGIPTSSFRVFKEYSSLLAYLESSKYPLVLKASGLAAGKGTFICQSFEEANTTARLLMMEKILGEAADEVVVEEFLIGSEVSIMAIADGADDFLLPPSRDHKRAFDGDHGPNTGGMGVICPVVDLKPEEERIIEEKIVKQILKALEKQGSHFKGCLYPGLMMTREGPFVLEINVRFGDPETQAVVPLLNFDLLELFAETVEGNLKGWLNSHLPDNKDWRELCRPMWAVTVVIASGGYPGQYQKGIPIKKLPKEKPELIVFHAGTEQRTDGLYTAGGRVFSVTGLGETLEMARERAYRAVREVEFEGMFYRKDIGVNPSNGVE
ncbi:MAG: phosphoribosylamine--glycine ligase [bacterium]